MTDTPPDDLIVATPAHAALLAAIHAEAFLPGENWDEAAFARLLGLPGVHGLIDPRGGMVLLRRAADEAEVLTLAVIPAMQRQGIGKGLLRAGMCKVRAAGARTLFLEVSSSNTAAQLLYASGGFREVGRRKRYYVGGDALVLRLELDP